MKRLDLKGRKIGELTVVGYSHSHVQPSGQKRAMWHVECSCGVSKAMSASSLTHGKTLSCGHVGAEKRAKARLLPDNQAEKNYVYLAYRGSALARGIIFDIEKQDFLEIIKMDCAYCGCGPSNMRKPRSSNGSPFLYNGIDRIDSDLGYVLGNVTASCQRCNFMKGSLGRNEFIEHLKRIISHVEKGL